MAKESSTSSLSLDRFLNPDRLGELLAGVLILALGLFVARMAASLFERSMQARLTPHQLSVSRRAIHHGLLILFTITALREMGFNLSVLLGAAGLLTVAIGFASQTSASNLISGIFLIGEGSFAIGDFIRVGQTEGEVLSIDLLSVKLRTPDNLFVRIPNEQLIKTELINLTRFPIRRLNIAVGVAYKEDVPQVRELLLCIARDNPLCLDEPAALVIVSAFAESAINLQFLVWTRRENVFQVRNELQEAIKAAFDESGIEIPFPQLAINAGSKLSPQALSMLSPDAAAAGGSRPKPATGSDAKP